MRKLSEVVMVGIEFFHFAFLDHLSEHDVYPVGITSLHGIVCDDEGFDLIKGCTRAAVHVQQSCLDHVPVGCIIAESHS